ncbi:von Willebrand factor A domain-containing protein 5A-like [Entamoeba marina]
MTNVEQYGIPFDFGSITNNNIKLQDVVYNVIINGVFAIINVHHKFRNISQSVCSADFEFQLHTRCSLINVKAKTQTQTFETKLVEKDEAKEVYEEEKSKGHSTFLLQQLNKSNYQFSFGNCNPNDIIDVFIEYITFLTYSQNAHSNMISTICLNDESFNNINNTPIFEVTIPMTCNTKPIHGSIQMNSLSITDNLKYDSTNILSFYDPSLTSYRSYIYI